MLPLSSFGPLSCLPSSPARTGCSEAIGFRAYLSALSTTVELAGMGAGEEVCPLPLHTVCT